ncbi:MAG: Zn-dependent exopeptidase M28 [Clostridia bacterium]|nr:Zn-dependent exopeptidase M28 [Clostridia bacterium]
MDRDGMLKIFTDLDCVHRSGTAEELAAAEYLKNECEKLGVSARVEAFPVPMAEIEEAHVYADGVEIPAKGLFLCGSGEAEGELYYMPATDRVSMSKAKDKIVLMDTLGIRRFDYQDIVKAGAKGLLFQYGNMYHPFKDIDERDLRPAVVGDEKKLISAMLNAGTAVELVKKGVKRVKIVVRQREYEGESHNVVAEIPGKRDEFITMTAHYDTVSNSHGSYDNLSGCVGLLGVMEALMKKELNYGLRFVFCGSEERGLLGSKAYVASREEELEKIPLNINLDMIGSVMGRFISCVSAEEKLEGYVSYLAAELGFPVSSRVGVYSSDSTPFADKGVPAISFARIARGDVAPIHCRLDTPELMSMEQLEKDIGFITEFTRRMACSAVCPVSREIPEKVKKDLDEYLYRKRPEH